MAAQTWFIDWDIGVLTPSDTGAEITSGSGWTVAKVAPTVYAIAALGTERASSAFGATAVPDGTTSPSTDAVTSSGPSPSFAQFNVDGQYAAGTWTLTTNVIAVSSGGDQDGLVRAAIWKKNIATGVWTKLAGPTEGTAVTNLTAAAAQTSTVTFSGVAAASLAWEQLAVEVGWKITGAGGANTRDVLLRRGSAIKLVTPEFYPEPRSAGVNFQDPGVFMGRLGAKWERTRDRIWLPNFGGAMA